jgi:hypothetical protein
VSLGPIGVASAFATLLLGVVGLSIINLGIVFNYVVGLFHHRPVRQGLLGRPILPGLDRWFGWIGLGATLAGVVVASVSTWLGLAGWDITRLWLWLLGSALLVLSGVQLFISWVLMRVLEVLAVRGVSVERDLGDHASALEEVEPAWGTAQGATT